jgi:hypothetical protein
MIAFPTGSDLRTAAILSFSAKWIGHRFNVDKWSRFIPGDQPANDLVKHVDCVYDSRDLD